MVVVVVEGAVVEDVGGEAVVALVSLSHRCCTCGVGGEAVVALFVTVSQVLYLYLSLYTYWVVVEGHGRLQTGVGGLTGLENLEKLAELDYLSESCEGEEVRPCRQQCNNCWPGLAQHTKRWNSDLVEKGRCQGTRTRD